MVGLLCHGEMEGLYIGGDKETSKYGEREKTYERRRRKGRVMGYWLSDGSGDLSCRCCCFWRQPASCEVRNSAYHSPLHYLTVTAERC